MKKLLAKKRLLILISALLVIVSVMGKIVSVQYHENEGWQYDGSNPFWDYAIAWGVLYCLLLWYKKLMPQQHPVLWFVGIVPIIYGLYVGTMMGGFGI